jgi:hypothetical protein
MNDHIHPAFRAALSVMCRETDEAYEYQAQLQREHDLHEALDTCHKHGVPEAVLKTLIYETGARSWSPRKE